MSVVSTLDFKICEKICIKVNKLVDHGQLIANSESTVFISRTAVGDFEHEERHLTEFTTSANATKIECFWHSEFSKLT